MPLIVRHFCDFTNMWTLRYAAVIMFHWSCIKIALRAVGKYLTGLKMFVPLIARIQTHAIICILVARSPVFVGRCKYTPLGSRRQRMRRLALWRSSGSQIVCALLWTLYEVSRFINREEFLDYRRGYRLFLYCWELLNTVPKKNKITRCNFSVTKLLLDFRKDIFSVIDTYTGAG